MTSVARSLFLVLGEVCRVIEKDWERASRLYSGLRFIKDEMESVGALIKQDEKNDGLVQDMRIRRFQELAYDIEDFVESLWEPGKYGYALVAVGADPRPPQLVQIDYFKDRLVGLKDLKLNAQSSQDDCDSDHGDGASVDMDCEVIDGPKNKIEELLLSPAANELRVIFIVGCRGVGKTALARAVYRNRHVRDQFEYVVWFEASGCNDKETLLSKPPEEDAKQPDGRTTTPANLKEIAADTRRYLAFVDGVQQAHVWKETVNDLLKKYECSPENVRGSTIIVTTSVHSVSSAGGYGRYVYVMQCLGKDESKKLFWRKVYDSDNRTPPTSLVIASSSIFSKCDGLPLALTSVAKHLSLNGLVLESEHFKEVEENLGKFLSSNSSDVFRKMRRALMQCYESLPDYDDRYCLLYLSIFPMGHQIKSKSLVRRLMAEGLVEAAQDGCVYLNKLTDQCIVDPVQFSSDSRDAKRIKVHGVVLEYIIEKSLSRNVVTLITEKGVLKVNSSVGRVRRLSVQSSTQGKCDLQFELDISKSVRSLTIFNSDFDFQKCKMLRLLDLEGCTGLRNKSFRQDICELLLLKYLSLRKTGVNKVPSTIKKLKRLETLDIRETSEIELPIEAIELPKLAYLFGKFKLPKVSKTNSSFGTFLSNESNLHTLSGIVVDDIDRKRSSELVVLLARKLKKIKIWCHETAAGVPMSVSHHDQASTNAVAIDNPPKKQKCYWRPHRKVDEGRMMNRCRETAAEAPMSVPDPDHESTSAAALDTPPINPDHMKVDKEGPSGNFDLVVRLLKMRFTSLESVSIISSGLCKKFLGSLEGPCTISSIKLWGKLDSLPNKLSELVNIKKLQLFSTGLSSEDLSALQNLRGLEYLKLVEHGDGFDGLFTVKNLGFESLKRLCIEAPKFPELQLEEGAMECLISLHLLCPDSSHIEKAATTIKGIEYLQSLSEVVLASSASEEAMQAWEKVTNRHPKKPWVKQLKSGD